MPYYYLFSILFLVIGSIETIIAIGVVLSFGRGALAG